MSIYRRGDLNETIINDNNFLSEFKNLLFDAGPPDACAGFKDQIENAVSV